MSRDATPAPLRQQSSQWLFTEYAYYSGKAPKTGYQNMATYYYRLDDSRYICIYMMPPV